MRLNRPDCLLLALFIFLCAPVAALPSENSVLQKTGSQKKARQTQSKGFWCASDYSTVAADSQLTIEQPAEGVVLGQPVRKVTPGYPLKAKIERSQGNVIVVCLVSRAGDIASIKSVSGPPALMEASAEAAKLWRFMPTTVKGEAVEASAAITFKYDLGWKTLNDKSAVKRTTHKR